MLTIVPYEPAHEPAVRAFNGRLAAAGIRYVFPESSVATWLPPTPGERLWQEQFVAVEGDHVRGGYILKHQDFRVGGETRSIGAFQLPLSEGTIDRAYSAVGVQLLRHALRRQPLLYTLGIGSRQEAAARLLVAARFSVEAVPFFFRVEHGRPFLRNIQPLRTPAARRLLVDLAARTGAGAAGLRVVHRLRTRAAPSMPVTVEHPTAFDDSADSLWAAAAPFLDLAAIRDRRVLARLYDAPGNRFLRVAISEAGELRGWAVLLGTRGAGHKYFGDMHFGSIVDLLAAPGFERSLIDASVARLRAEGVDIIVTNQSLRLVADAVRDAGFLPGPSNYLLAVSPALAELTGPVRAQLGAFHFTRGDGDGPINL